MITVITSVGGDTVTIDAHGAKMVVSVPAAYQLLAHLQYSLEQLIADQVALERQNLVTARYKP